MAVRVVFVRRTPGDADGNQRNDIGRGVGEGMEAVGEDGDRAGGDAERNLGNCDGQIEEQDAVENGGDRSIPVV